MFTKRLPKNKSYRCKKCGKVDRRDFPSAFSGSGLKEVAKEMGIEVKNRKRRKRKNKPRNDTKK